MYCENGLDVLQNENYLVHLEMMVENKQGDKYDNYCETKGSLDFYLKCHAQDVWSLASPQLIICLPFFLRTRYTSSWHCPKKPPSINQFAFVNGHSVSFDSNNGNEEESQLTAPVVTGIRQTQKEMSGEVGRVDLELENG